MADSSKPKAGGLWGRLFGLGSENEEPAPNADAALAAPPPPAESTPPEPAAPVEEAAPAPVAEEQRFNVVATIPTEEPPPREIPFEPPPAEEAPPPGPQA